MLLPDCVVSAFLYVLILRVQESQYVWLGEHCSTIVRNRVAPFVAAATRGDRSAAQTIEEGSETKAFKDAIGYKAEYARHEKRPNNLPVKLFVWCGALLRLHVCLCCRRYHLTRSLAAPIPTNSFVAINK